MRALVGKPSQYGLPDPDYRLQPLLHRFTRLSGWLANRVLRGHFRWQTLPAPFILRLEGLNVNAFEEFGAGEILRNFKDPDEPYAKVKNTDFTLGQVSIKWFEDGVLNASVNCIDRHLPKRAGQTAIIFEPDDPETPARHIT